MKKYIKFLSICSILIFASCSSDSEENMQPQPPINSDVSYTNTIKSIIDSKCISCHATTPTNGAPMSLTTYDNVKEAVQNRDLIGNVESGAMPPSGTDLTNAQVQAIKDWQTGGFVN